MKTLDGGVAVVTGGASGIGYALAERFVAAGMSVVIADVQQDALDAAVADLRQGGGKVVGVRCDVASPADVQALADRTLEVFGRVTVLCNNAGVESGAPFSEIPDATWDWVMGVDFWGVVNGCRTFLPLLRREKEAHIVNTASLAAFNAEMITAAPYVTAKFAVLGLTETLFHELDGGGEPIGVSVLAPGAVNTNIGSSERNRPDSVPNSDEHPARKAFREWTEAGDDSAIEASIVADLVVEAIRENRFYVLPHRDLAVTFVEQRLERMHEA